MVIVPIKNGKSWNFCSRSKLAISYFPGMWKFCDLLLHKRRIYPTSASFSLLPFLPLLQLLEYLSWYMRGHNLTMNFPPDISITTEDWTALWIPSPNLPLLHQIDWFRLQTSLICNKENENSVMWEVVARRCSAKALP